MAAALGAPNPNDSIGILAEDVNNAANSGNIINTNLMRACTNLGYDIFSSFGLYVGGFDTPSDNTVCWAAGSGVDCQNAQAASNPDYVGNFYCKCNP